MADGAPLKLFVKGNADIADAVLSVADGGTKLDRGVRELVGAEYPGVTMSVGVEESSGFAALRSDLETGGSRLVAEKPDIVVLSIGDEVRALPGRAPTVEGAVRAVAADLMSCVQLLKQKVGAHVLVANASTLDPDNEVFSYHGLAEEPLSLRAHRLDLMLVGVSHDEGISIIDIDRKIAELGGERGIVAALDYTPEGCAVIAGEIVRVLADYGFFDDRPLLAQVGAGGSS